MKFLIGFLLLGLASGCAHLKAPEKIELTKVGEVEWNEIIEKGRAPFVRAASGVVVLNGNIYVVSDDEPDLFFKKQGSAEWQVRRGLKLDLSRAQDRKAFKPDFEAIFHLTKEDWPPHGALVAWPSGSGPKRMQAAVFTLDQDSEPKFLKSVSILKMAEQLKKHTQDLNIEGALAFENRFLLFQRGNASGSPNQIFSFPKAAFVAGLKRSFWRSEEIEAFQVQAVDLGQLAKFPVTFADASASARGLYVLGSAEKTMNSYADGEILGTVLFEVIEEDGIFKASRLGLLNPHGKYEGVAMNLKTGNLVIVDDADSPEKKSGIFEVPAGVAAHGLNQAVK